MVIYLELMLRPLCLELLGEARQVGLQARGPRLRARRLRIRLGQPLPPGLDFRTQLRILLPVYF